MDTTRITETSQTLIDLLFSNTPEGLTISNLAKKQYLATSQTLIALLFSNTPEGLMNPNLAKKQYLVGIMKTTTQQKLLNKTQDFAYDKNYPNST